MTYIVSFVIFLLLFFSILCSQNITLQPRLVQCAYAGYYQGITIFLENNSYVVGIRLICSRGDLIIEGKGIVKENYVFGKQSNVSVSRLCNQPDAINWIYEDFVPACYPYQSNRENLTTSVDDIYIPFTPTLTLSNLTDTDLYWGDESCNMSGQESDEVVYKLLRTVLVTYTENDTLYEIVPQFCRDVYPRDVREVEGCGSYDNDNHPDDVYNVENPDNGNFICAEKDGWRDGLCQGYDNDYCKTVGAPGGSWYSCATSTRGTGGKDMYPSKYFFVKRLLQNHKAQCLDYDDLQTTKWFQIVNETTKLCIEIQNRKMISRECSEHNKNYGQYFRAILVEENSVSFYALEVGSLPGYCVSKLNKLIRCDEDGDFWYQFKNSPNDTFGNENFYSKIISPINRTEEIDYLNAFMNGFKKGFEKWLDMEDYWLGWNISYVQQVQQSVPLSYREVFERPEWCDWRQLWCNHEGRIFLMQPTLWDPEKFKLEGSLGNDVFKFPRLQGIAIQRVGIQSTLPYLGEVKKLFQSQNRKSSIRYLDFQKNQFSGVLPSDWGWQGQGQDRYNFFGDVNILLVQDNTDFVGGLPETWSIPTAPFSTDFRVEPVFIQFDDTQICYNQHSLNNFVGISRCNVRPDQKYFFHVYSTPKTCVDCEIFFNSSYNVSTAVRDLLGDVVRWQTVQVECQEKRQCKKLLQGRKMLQMDDVNSTVELTITGNGAKDQEETIQSRLQYNLPKIYSEQISEAFVVMQNANPVENQQQQDEKDSGSSTGTIIGIVVAIVVVLIIITIIIILVVKRNNKHKKINKAGLIQSLDLPDFTLEDFTLEEQPGVNSDNINSIISEIDKKWGQPHQFSNKSGMFSSSPLIINFIQESPSTEKIKLEIIPMKIQSSFEQESINQFFSLANNEVITSVSDDLPYEHVKNLFVVPENIEPNLEQQLFFNQQKLITRFTPALRDVDLEIDVDRDLKIVSEIGHGAFGMVYKAVWTKQSTGEKIEVAVKFMNPGLVAELSGKDGQQHLKNFKEELALMCKMRHPNIVKCYGGCLKPPKLAIVLEFMEGGNLHNYIHEVRKENKLSSDEVFRIMAHIAAALNYLHPSILHRDLKPKNVLLDKNGVPKISDFGLSKVRNQTMSMTINQVKGTPQYIAPEVWTGQLLVTEKCDIYSLGMIGWEMITGERPWRQCNTYMQILGLVSVFKKRPDIPQDCDPVLKELIQDCWDQDEKRRPAAGQIHRQILWLYQKENKNQQQ